MVVVEASLSLVTVSVLVATVLEIFHRFGQEILLLLTLTERFLKTLLSKFSLFNTNVGTDLVCVEQKK